MSLTLQDEKGEIKVTRVTKPVYVYALSRVLPAWSQRRILKGERSSVLRKKGQR